MRKKSIHLCNKIYLFFLHNLFYAISFFFPKISLCPVTLFLFHLNKENNIHIKTLYITLSTIIFFSQLVVWIYINTYESKMIFFYFIAYLFGQYIFIYSYFSMSKYYIKKTSFLLKILLDSAHLTFLFFILYHISGYLYTPSCICPFFYPLTPLAHFGFWGLPYFDKINYWVYLFLFQILVNFFFKLIHKRFLILSIYTVLNGIFFNKKQTFYWNKESGLSIKEYMTKKLFIFPEGMFDISNQRIIKKLKQISHKYKKNIIAGVYWYTIDEQKIVKKNGALFINTRGKSTIQEKKHTLRFTETKNDTYKINTEIKKTLPIHSYICSEFFLAPLDEYKKKSIIIASVDWTNHWLTKPYRQFMILIYQLKRLYHKKNNK